ncbi:MAG: hypothetical protein WAO23_03650 [Dethiobacteria bacterium]
MNKAAKTILCFGVYHLIPGTVPMAILRTIHARTFYGPDSHSNLRNICINPSIMAGKADRLSAIFLRLGHDGGRIDEGCLYSYY